MQKEFLSSRKIEKHLYYLKNRARISKRTKKYAQNHPEQCRKYTKKWLMNHPDYQKNYHFEHLEQEVKRYKKWAKDNPILIKENQRKYYKRHPERMREKYKNHRKKRPELYKGYDRKHEAKRRKLGFIPLNEPFEGSEGHHIDFTFVVYIPRELHISIRHCIWTSHNMELINAKAFEYLGMNEIGKPL